MLFYEQNYINKSNLVSKWLNKLFKFRSLSKEIGGFTKKTLPIVLYVGFGRCVVVVNVISNKGSITYLFILLGRVSIQKLV